MTRKIKGRTPGWHQATSKTSTIKFYFTCLSSHIKAVIATLVIWSLLLSGIANWIIQRFRLGGV